MPLNDNYKIFYNYLFPSIGYIQNILTLEMIQMCPFCTYISYKWDIHKEFNLRNMIEKYQDGSSVQTCQI